MNITGTWWRRGVAGTVLAAVLPLAACGGGGNEGAATTHTGSSADASGDDAFVSFQECMRQHGVDLPGGVGNRGADGAGDPQADPDFGAATTACQHLLEGVTLDDGEAPPLDPETEKAFLEYARCMRDHGINMPDPSNGGLVAQAGQEERFDPESPEFEAADEQCRGALASVEVDGTGVTAGAQG